MAIPSLRDAQESIGNLQDEFGRLVERVWHGGIQTRPLDGQAWSPPVDIFEHDDRFVLFAEVPGVEPADIEVSYVGQTLTIRGERRPCESVDENTPTFRRERRFGVFCRNIDLPVGVEMESLSAKSKIGVLQITIAKTEASKPKSVQVTVEGG